MGGFVLTVLSYDGIGASHHLTLWPARLSSIEMDALAALQPTAETYARLPVAEAFNWADCAPGVAAGEWYLVAFRSIVSPDADIARLTVYDDFAHADAANEPGFVHYFKGPLADDGTCLSFCLWNSRTEARAAASRPAHLEAVAIIGETYSQYTLEFLRLRKPHAEAAFEFAPYDAVERPPAAAAHPTLTFGLKPAS